MVKVKMQESSMTIRRCNETMFIEKKSLILFEGWMTKLINVNARMLKRLLKNEVSKKSPIQEGKRLPNRDKKCSSLNHRKPSDMKNKRSVWKVKFSFGVLKSRIYPYLFF